MNKRNEELLSLLSELVKHKTYLESVKKSYETVFKTKNKNLKSASLEHLQRQLKLLISVSQECLEHIQQHHRILSKQDCAEAMKVIGGIIKEVDQYLPEKIISKESYDDFSSLFNNLLKTHEFITTQNGTVIVDVTGESKGKDKLLLKNLRGQLNYLDKLLNIPDNFSPKNIKKTEQRIENVSLILDQLIDKIEKSPSRDILTKLHTQAINKLDDLYNKIMESKIDHAINNKTLGTETPLKWTQKQPEKSNPSSADPESPRGLEKE